MEGQSVRFVLGVENVSFFHFGEVALDGKVNTVTENGETGGFDVVDNDTVRFCEGESTANAMMFPDGTLFKYVDKSDR